MQISKDNLEKLKTLLRKQTGEVYDEERAQAAGKAIIRFVGIKLYQQFEKDQIDEKTNY